MSKGRIQKTGNVRTKSSNSNRKEAKSAKAKSDTNIISKSNRSIYKKEDGWYFSDRNNGNPIGPYRTRDLARQAKKDDIVAEKINDADAMPIEEKKYAYKVVRKHPDGILGSASVSKSSALWKEYKPGEITEVDKELFDSGFGLCCFRTIEETRDWKDVSDYSYARYELWKVEVGELREPAAKRPPVSFLGHSIKKDHLSTRDILNIINNNLRRDSWPSGCVVADWVKLVEKVQ